MKKIFMVMFVSAITASLILSFISEPAAQEEKGTYGGVLTIRDSLPPDFVFGDPVSIAGPGTMRASVALQRLLLPGDAPGAYTYQLATGFKLAPDKSYYDLFLRKGVTFHDGTPFNAEAAKWNLDRALKAGRNEFKTVSSFEVIDDYTLRMNLNEWTNRVLNDFMHDIAYIISPTAYKKNGEDWCKQHPVGTGPFKFVELKENQILIWEKYDGYWDEGLPYLDGVEMHCIPDPVVAGMAMRAGEIDASWEGVDEETRKVMEKDPDFTVYVSDGEFTTALYMNTIDPANPWSNPLVRQAFEYAFNKEDVIKAVLNEHVYPVYNCIKGLEWSRPEVKEGARKYDPDKAKELLARAGYKDGLDFTWIIGTASWSAADRNAYLAWQAQLAQSGFRAKFEIIEPSAAREMERSPLANNTVNTAMLRGNISAPIEVAMEVLVEGGLYFVGVKRPDQLPALLDHALHTVDPEESLDTLVKLDKICQGEAMFIPLQNHPLIPVVNTKFVHNFVSQREGLLLDKCWKGQ